MPRLPTVIPFHVGTSGWGYPQWKEGFYGNVASKDWLARFAAQFDTVEINNSFYRLPSTAALTKWHDAVPDDFRFSVKAWRQITHDKKLRDVQDDTLFFLGRLQALKKKLGPVLFQLPPGLRLDEALLRDFLQGLPRGLRYAVEFRLPEWRTDTVLAMLAEHDCAFVCSLNGRETPDVPATASWGYMRLHGPERFRGKYTPEYLQTCADWLREQSFKQAFVYFNNTIHDLDALINARDMNVMLNGWNRARPFFIEASKAQFDLLARTE